MFWRASPRSVQLSVRNALRLAGEVGFESLAMPTIGTGTGGLSEDRVVGLAAEEVEASDFPGLVRIVRFRR